MRRVCENFSLKRSFTIREVLKIIFLWSFVTNININHAKRFFDNQFVYERFPINLNSSFFFEHSKSHPFFPILKLFSQNHSETSSRRFSSFRIISQKKNRFQVSKFLSFNWSKKISTLGLKLNQLPFCNFLDNHFSIFIPRRIGEFASCVVTRAYVHTTVVYTPQGIWKRESLDCYSIHVPLNLTYSLSLAEQTVSLAPTTKRRVPLPLVAILAGAHLRREQPFYLCPAGRYITKYSCSWL